MTANHNSQKRDSEDHEANLRSAEEMHGHENPSILAALNAAAESYLFNGEFARAEELLLRAAAITGSQKPDKAESVKLAKQKLGWLYLMEDRFEDAEQLFCQAYETSCADKKAAEEELTHACRCLAYFYIKTERLAEAEKTLLKLLNHYQHVKQEPGYKPAYALISLAVIADAAGNIDAAKAYAEKAAALIKDKCAIGYTVDYLSLSEIINLYLGQERKLEAREIVACTLLECEDHFWPHNPVAADALYRLAEYMRGQRKFKQAESLYKRAIAIKELTAGHEDVELARISFDLGNMYLNLRKYADAEPLVKSSMKARVKHYGTEHPTVAACVETYATILRKTKRAALANKLEMRAREIRSACVARYDRERTRV